MTIRYLSRLILSSALALSASGCQVIQIFDHPIPVLSLDAQGKLLPPNPSHHMLQSSTAVSPVDGSQ